MRSSTDKINQKINNSQNNSQNNLQKNSQNNLQNNSQNNLQNNSQKNSQNNSQNNNALDQQSTIFQPIIIDDDYITKQPSRPLNHSAKEAAKQPTQELATPSAFPLNQSMLSSFFLMNGNKTPIKHRPIADYVLIGENSTKSFHKVDKIKKIITSKITDFTRFFKHNPVNSLMSELEAVCGEYFRFLATDHAPTGRAHMDADKNYIGFSSKEMPGFKSLKDDPLKDEDLEIKCLDNGWYTIPELDDIDASIARDRQTALDHYDKEKNPEYLDQYNLEKMNSDQVIWEDKKNNRFVTVKDLRNYRITKGLGITLMTSFILGEDDCHRGNISKGCAKPAKVYGIRIDFDMILWWILCHYKKGSIIDWTFRFPDGSTFALHPDDIKTFPNLTHADPFYWPGKRKGSTSRLGKVLADSILAKKLSTSTNGYRTEDYDVFEKLEKHDVFKYHINATLLKFILTEGEMYRNMAKLHIREHVIIDDKVVPIVDILTHTMSCRVNEFRKVLMEMPQFYEFFNTVDRASKKKHGEIILKKINEQFSERNTHYQTKERSEYKEQMTPINLFEKQYDNFFKAAKDIHDKIYIDPLVEEFSMVDLDQPIAETLDVVRHTIKT